MFGILPYHIKHSYCLHLISEHMVSSFNLFLRCTSAVSSDNEILQYKCFDKITFLNLYLCIVKMNATKLIY